MIVFDRLIGKGLTFVLRRIADAADAEGDDDATIREALLEAQMRHELGELSDAELAQLEQDLIPRLQAAQQGDRTAATPGAWRVASIEAEGGGDEGGAEPARRTPKVRRRKKASGPAPRAKGRAR